MKAGRVVKANAVIMFSWNYWITDHLGLNLGVKVAIYTRAHKQVVNKEGV